MQTAKLGKDEKFRSFEYLQAIFLRLFAVKWLCTSLGIENIFLHLARNSFSSSSADGHSNKTMLSSSFVHQLLYQVFTRNLARHCVEHKACTT